MKHLLLLLALLGAAGSAQAQLVNLLSVGARLGADAAVAGGRNRRDDAPDRYVTTATYRGQAYSQKRTPANKLKGSGGPQIAYQESVLQRCQAALQADSTSALGTPDTWAMLRGSLEVIGHERPTWNIDPYVDEAAFYQSETARRQRAAARRP
jgi:hypothetical protein